MNYSQYMRLAVGGLRALLNELARRCASHEATIVQMHARLQAVQAFGRDLLQVARRFEPPWGVREAFIAQRVLHHSGVPGSSNCVGQTTIPAACKECV